MSFTDTKQFNILLLIMLSLLWGSSYGLISIGLKSFPFITFMAFRSIIACFVLYLIIIAMKAKFSYGLDFWIRIFWQSLFGNIIPMLLVAWAQQTVPSSVATVLGSTIPLFVFVFAILFTNEKLVIRNLVGVILGFIGVLLAIGTDIKSASIKSIIPYAAILGSSASYAIASIYAKKLSDVSSLFAAIGSMVWASIILLALALFFEDMSQIQITVESLSVLICLGAFCTGLAFWLLFKVRNALGPIMASAQVYMRIPVGISIGIFFLGERLSTETALGFLSLGLGVFLMVTPSSIYRKSNRSID